MAPNKCFSQSVPQSLSHYRGFARLSLSILARYYGASALILINSCDNCYQMGCYHPTEQMGKLRLWVFLCLMLSGPDNHSPVTFLELEE